MRLQQGSRLLLRTRSLGTLLFGASRAAAVWRQTSLIVVNPVRSRLLVVVVSAFGFDVAIEGLWLRQVQQGCGLLGIAVGSRCRVGQVTAQRWRGGAGATDFIGSCSCRGCRRRRRRRVGAGRYGRARGWTGWFIPTTTAASFSSLLFFFEFHAAILEPDFDLALGQVEQSGHLDPTWPAQVAIKVKFFLQFNQLGAGVGGASSFGWLFCNFKDNINQSINQPKLYSKVLEFVWYQQDFSTKFCEWWEERGWEALEWRRCVETGRTTVLGDETISLSTSR